MSFTLNELAAEINDLKIRLDALHPGRAPEALLDYLDRDLELLLSDYRTGVELSEEMLSPLDRLALEREAAAAETAASVFSGEYASQRQQWQQHQAALEADFAGTSKFFHPKLYKRRQEKVRNNLRFEPTPTGSVAQNAADAAAQASELRERLAVQDRFRAANSAALDAGAVADQGIRAAAETRVRNMLTAHVSPPRWFEAGLGRIDQSHDQERWLQVAVEVLEFRLRHSITDDLLPLGTTPENEDEHSQRRRLIEKLDGLKERRYTNQGDGLSL